MSSQTSERPIVCNAGPLIALAKIQQLELLPSLFHRVLLPEAVYHEIVSAGIERDGAREIKTAAWLDRVTLEQPPDPLLSSELGAGEAEVIALAHRLEAWFVLIDERRARRIAEQEYRLRVKGSAGILIAAKKEGLIPAVRPLLKSLCDQGYFFSQRVFERACQVAGE